MEKEQEKSEEVFVPTELRMRASAKLAKEIKKELKDKDEKSVASLIKGKNEDTA